LAASDADVEAVTSTSYTFTTHKNGHRNEKVVQGSSSDAFCCLVKATIQRVRHHRVHSAKQTALIAAYYGPGRTPIKSWDATALVWCAMMMNYARTGIAATEIGARFLRADGFMAMICGKIDLYRIRMVG
jgi:hypothetical protein